MHHCMIDIETIGKRPNAPILSIGAVKFDPETGTLGDTFYKAIDVADSFKYGIADGSTFKWWMEQGDAARYAAVGGRDMLPVALNSLAGFYKNWSNTKVWGNGPSFDMTILEYGFYRALDREAPWSFWNIRCCRTIADAAGLRPPKLSAAQGVHHNALDDSIHQAKWVSRYWQQLRNKPKVQRKQQAPATIENDDVLGGI